MAQYENMDLSKYEAHPDDMQNCETASKMSNPDLALLSFPSASLPSSNLASAILQVPTMRLEASVSYELLHRFSNLLYCTDLTSLRDTGVPANGSKCCCS